MNRISTQKSIGLGCLLGLLSSIAVIGATYVVDQLTGLGFPPFALFDFVSRILPGALITAIIDWMVGTIAALNLGPTADVAKLSEQALALIQFMVIGAVLGGFLGALRNRINRSRMWLVGLAIGLLLAALFGGIQARVGLQNASLGASFLWLVLVFGGWGLTLGWMLGATVRTRETQLYENGLSRREVLAIGGATLVAAIVSLLGLEYIVSAQESSQAAQPPPTPASPLTAGGVSTAPTDESLANRIAPAPGTRSEVTPNDDFYRIDINTRPPSISQGDWRLEIAGLVDNPMSLTLEQIRQRPSVSQYVTLSCISNRIGGDLISTALWTGIRLKDLLDEVGLHDNVKALAIEARDGFYETVVMDDMMDERTLLVYEMNGEPLPEEHGFPLRIYIPNRYGMKQPKWITKITAVAEDAGGYWVIRGWSPTAIMRTTSVIDAASAETDGAGRTVMGGIAHAGDRGISRVEVQVDEGSWEQAILRVPPLSSLTWVQWRFEGTYDPGDHVARVRAYDGSGELQIVEESPPHPNGATGIDTFSFEV